VVVLNLHDDDIQNRAGETLLQCTDPCGRRNMCTQLVGATTPKTTEFQMRWQPGERPRTRCDAPTRRPCEAPLAEPRTPPSNSTRGWTVFHSPSTPWIPGVRSIAGRAASRRRGLHQVPRWFATCCVGMLADLRQAANTGPRVPITDCRVMIC